MATQRRRYCPRLQAFRNCERQPGVPHHPAARDLPQFQRAMSQPVSQRRDLKHKARRIQIDVGNPHRRDHPITPPFRRSQPNKNHLILFVVDDVFEGRLQVDLFALTQITLENRVLQMITKILARLEDLSQPFVVGDIVADQVGDSHGGLGWIVSRVAFYRVKSGTYSGISPVKTLARIRACSSRARR